MVDAYVKHGYKVCVELSRTLWVDILFAYISDLASVYILMEAWQFNKYAENTLRA